MFSNGLVQVMGAVLRNSTKVSRVQRVAAPENVEDAEYAEQILSEEESDESGAEDTKANDDENEEM